MVMNVAAADVALPIRGIEAVALGQEVLERPGRALERLPHGAVAGRELRPRRAPVRARAPVANLVVHRTAVHLCIEVGQVEGGPGEPDGHRVAGIQGEEPDAGLAPGRYVGAQVELREAREPGYARQEARPHTGHAERRDAQPGAAVEGVEAEGGWDQRPEHTPIDGPVHEEQVVPAHKERPRARRDGVGPVLHPAQDRLGPQRLHDPRNPMTLTPGRPCASAALSGVLLRLVYHQEHATLYADPARCTGQLVMKT